MNSLIYIKTNTIKNIPAGIISADGDIKILIRPKSASAWI